MDISAPLNLLSIPSFVVGIVAGIFLAMLYQTRYVRRKKDERCEQENHAKRISRCRRAVETVKRLSGEISGACEIIQSDCGQKNAQCAIMMTERVKAAQESVKLLAGFCRDLNDDLRVELGEPAYEDLSRELAEIEDCLSSQENAIPPQKNALPQSNHLSSIQRQLAEARENLRLIQERKAKYVFGTDAPLQLDKEERFWLGTIAALEQQLATQPAEDNEPNLLQEGKESISEQPQTGIGQ